mgnify:CR=1 FL=1
MYVCFPHSLCCSALLLLSVSSLPSQYDCHRLGMSCDLLWITPISHFLCFSDTYEKERGRLQSANQDMSGQIERLKDQLSSHKEEAQKYKQKCITLEQRLIETEARLNKSEESQMSHDNIQDKLHKRYCVYIKSFISFRLY